MEWVPDDGNMMRGWPTKTWCKTINEDIAEMKLPGIKPKKLWKVLGDYLQTAQTWANAGVVLL